MRLVGSRALLRGLDRGPRELHDVLEVGGGVPALALDGDVVGDRAGRDLALHLAVRRRRVAALDAEPGVLHLVRVVGRVDAVLVTVLGGAVLHRADRDGLVVEALLRPELPVGAPDEAADEE